jgi:hypothetical protein
VTGTKIVQTSNRKARFKELEQVVRHSLPEALKHFVEVGKALKEIRNERFYKDAGYDTFDEYLDERWDLSRSYASRLINGAATVTKLAGMGVPAGIVRNEYQTRLLRPRLPEVSRRITVNDQDPKKAIREVLDDAKHAKPVANGNNIATARDPDPERVKLHTPAWRQELGQGVVVAPEEDAKQLLGDLFAVLQELPLSTAKALLEPYEDDFCRILGIDREEASA